LRGGRDQNEDNFLVAQDGQAWLLEDGAEVRRELPGHGLLVGVADGMGGHEEGALASAAAIQTLVRLYAKSVPGDREEFLRHWIQRSHELLRARVRARGTGNMGSTLAAIWLVHDQIVWSHVGDSRIYRYSKPSTRPGAVEGLVRLTRDHTRGEFAARDGRPRPPQPDALTQNFLFGSRNLGDDARIRLDPGVDSGTFPAIPRERLLLCTDGLHGAVAEPQLAAVLERAIDPLQACSTLVDLAMANGSRDNITAIVVDLGPPAPWEEEGGMGRLW
jgi:serine/threonine protein phosphatase PrpC